jgi:hypothetical protein
MRTRPHGQNVFDALFSLATGGCFALAAVRPFGGTRDDAWAWTLLALAFAGRGVWMLVDRHR